MLGLVVLATAVWFGFACLRIAGVGLPPHERLIVAPVIGIVGGFWVVYMVAAAAGGLSPAVLAGCAGLFALTGLAARARPPLPEGPAEPWLIMLAAGVGAVIVTLNVTFVMASGPAGNLLAAEHVWADLPFHASITTSFAYRPNMPPMYPMALDAPLGYPFLVNIVSAALVHAGWSLRWAFVVPGVVIQLAFFCTVAAVTFRLSGSRRAAVLATITLLFLGNLGWLAVPGDIRTAGGLSEWMRELPWSYTGDALGGPGRERLGTGLYLGNPTFMYLLPRRAAMLGITVGLGVLLLLDELAERPRAGLAAMTGIVIGILPRVHGHTLLAVAVIAAIWGLLLPLRRGAVFGRGWVEVWREAIGLWLLTAGIALAVALPQLWVIREQAVGFLSWWPGWIGEPADAFGAAARATGSDRVALGSAAAATLVRFWALNAGMLAVLLVPALIRGGRRIVVWYLPFVVLWLIGNLVRTQPWEWDNTNWFVYWQVGTAVVAASWLASLFRELPWEVPAGTGRARRMVRPVIGAVLVASLTIGGLLSLVFGSQQRHHLWGPEDMQFADEVRRRTPADAVVLTSNGHTHPVIALSGRQAYMGFAGWLSTHGLDWDSYDQRLRRMYEGDLDLMRTLGVDHVVVGSWERGLEGVELSEAFEDPTVFEEVYRQQVMGGDWVLLRLRPLSR